MANLTFETPFDFETFLINRILSPTSRIATTTSITYLLNNHIELILNGNFTLNNSENPTSGSIHSLEYKQNSNTIWSISNLSLSLSQFLTIASSNNINALFAGTDLLQGSTGNDTLVGGSGNDIYVVDSNSDVIIETSTSASEIDSVRSTASFNFNIAQRAQLENLTLLGNSRINGTGNAKANILTGNAGNNVLLGLNGNDTIIAGAGNDSADGGSGNDSLDGGIGIDTLVGGSGNDIYIVDSNSDAIIETSTSASEIDSVRSTASFNFNIAQRAQLENLTLLGNSRINGTGNAKANILTGNAGNNVLLGLNGNDTIIAGAGNDSVDGGSGNDSLDGGIGIDTLVGSSGNDIYIVDSNSDVIIETSTSASEIDSVRSTASFNFNIAQRAQLENLTLLGNSRINGTGNAKANILTGNAGNNVLLGLNGNDTIIAGAGNDSVDGGSGNDSLDGGIGIDTLVGGSGNDIYVVDSNSDVIIETSTSASEIDSVQSTVSFSLNAAGRSQIENLKLLGTSNLSGTGNTKANVLIGNSGNNSLIGGAGADTIDGGEGIDTVSYASASAGVTVLLTQGTVTGGDTDRLLNIENVIGSNFNDSITGKITGTSTPPVRPARGQTGNTSNTDNNTLYNTSVIDGGNGNDTIYGTSDNCLLIGGNGNDRIVSGTNKNVTLLGGAGNDILIGSSFAIERNIYNTNHNSTVIASYEFASGAIFASIDTPTSMFFSIVSGSDGIDSLEGIDNIKGSAYNDIISDVTQFGISNNHFIGDAGNDTISGGTGEDTLTGGIGNDSLDGGEDIDTVDYSDAGNAVNVNLSTGTGTGTATGTDVLRNFENILGSLFNDTLTGNSLDNTIAGSNGRDSIIGNPGNDLLSGGDSNDTIIGGSGNDTLDGGTGADSTSGGPGDDIYYIDNPLDVIIETSSGGNDTVYSSISYALPYTIENSIITGTGNSTLTGNNANNALTGNSGDNLLAGLSGNDTLSGADGNDTLTGGNGNDLILGGGGIDTVDYSSSSSAISIDLTPVNNSGLMYGPRYGTASGDGNDSLSGIENVIGSRYSDTIVGFTISGNSTISGGYGDDNITGGSFNDLIYGDQGNDTINGGYGLDSLFGGTGNDILTGGYQDDQLNGGAGNNRLDGGNGNDLADYSNSTGGAIVADLNTGIVTNSNTADSLISIEAVNGTRQNDRIGYFNGGITTQQLLLIGNMGDDTLVGSLGSDTLIGGTGNDIMNGGSQNDTYFVDSTLDQIIDDGGWFDIVYSSISYSLSEDIENLTLGGNNDINGTGNQFSNMLIGNAAANTLSGSSGYDTLSGGLGADQLTGGLDADRFRFESAADSTVSDMDIITDFNYTERDRIDLSNIDANTKTPYNDTFFFRNTLPFTGAAGDLRYEISDGNTLLMGDTDGNSQADFQVMIIGVITLDGSNLIL